MSNNIKYKLICESCGREQIYDNLKDAFDDGWDYPPFIGIYGVLSPRTCPNCDITQTLYWRLMGDGSYSLNSKDLEIINRIKNEPESMYVKE